MINYERVQHLIVRLSHLIVRYIVEKYDEYITIIFLYIYIKKITKLHRTIIGLPLQMLVTLPMLGMLISIVAIRTTTIRTIAIMSGVCVQDNKKKGFCANV